MPRRRRKRSRSCSVGSNSGGTSAGKRGGRSKRSSKEQEIKRHEEEEEEEEEDDDDEEEKMEDDESCQIINEDEDEDGNVEEEEGAVQKAVESTAAAAPGLSPTPVLGHTPSYKRLRSWRDPEKKPQGGMFLGMEAGESCCLVGSMGIHVLRGEVDILGHALRAPMTGPVPMHSPKWMSSLVITASSSSSSSSPENSSNINFLPSSLASSSLPVLLHLTPVSTSICRLPRFLTAYDDAEALWARHSPPPPFPPPLSPAPPPPFESGKDAKQDREEEQHQHQDEDNDGSVILHLPGAIVMEERVLVECLGLRPLHIPQSWKNTADEIISLQATAQGTSSPATATTNGSSSNRSNSSNNNRSSKGKEMLKKEAQREGGRECGLVIAICGGKGTGKSTFGRYLAHRFLASLPPALPPSLPPSVAYLDCDLKAKHLTLPPSLPLLVNMDGWVRGLGLELMRMLLCDLLAPDVVVKMEGSSKAAGFALPAPLPSHTRVLAVEAALLKEGGREGRREGGRGGGGGEQ
ncbi:Hypothetical protein NocV09_05100050 [Nannochloropsis oceanica]